MSRFRWNTPLDPSCPIWEEMVNNLWSDPMTAYSGVGDEVEADMAKRHIFSCERCQAHGLDNIEII